MSDEALRADEAALRERACAEIEARFMVLPRNEFGDEHYLAVEAAYKRAVVTAWAAVLAALASPAPTDQEGGR